MLTVILILLTSIGGGYLLLSSSFEDPRTEPPEPRNHVRFDGTVTWNGSFILDGELTLGGLDRNVTEFSNTSVKLYSEEGAFMEGRCLGTVSSVRSSNEVSVVLDERPTYVLFVSPDYWHPDRVERFQVINYRWENDQYVGYTWGEPSEVPVNPIANDPCQ